MTDEDPFDRAAAREQELRHQWLRRARNRQSPWRDGGTLVFFALWGVVLAGHYWLLGPGALFFVHASFYALMFCALFLPMLVLHALWAPFVVAQYHYFGWNTALKVHLLVFAVCAVPFLWLSLPDRDDKDPLERSLTA